MYNSITKILITLSFLIGLLTIGNSQSSFQIIDQIRITGNAITKDYIIYKELDFKVGDTIFSNLLEERIHKNEKRLYDTKLFNKVKVSYESNLDRHIDIIIYLENSWFIFPAPIFELGAENFTAWWRDYEFDTKWINYGIRLTHINLTGNQDLLKAVFQRGFTHKYELEYYRPYLFKSKTGFLVNAYYTTNTSIGYKTENNKLVYLHNKDKTLLKKLRLDASLFYRPTTFIYHQLKLRYHNNKIDKKIALELNPDYFLNQKTDLKYFFLSYHFKYDKRVFKLYPESGFMTFVTLKKQGLGIFKNIDLTSLTIGFEQYFHTKWDILLQSGIELKKELSKSKIPYSNYSAFGYGNYFIRGYESYVIDGKDYLIFRNSIRKSLYRKEIKYGKYMPLKPLKNMFTEVFLRFNLEMGYVDTPYYTPDDNFNNKILLGYGLGLDLVLYHNFLFNIEYNFNKEGNHSFYLHNNITF